MMLACAKRKRMPYSRKKKNCPHCYSEKVNIHSHYQTKGNGERKMFICQECTSCFTETYGSVIAGLETPLSEIVKVLKTRMEGIGLNAAARVFGYAKTTILNWEKKLSGLQETLFLYALVTGQWEVLEACKWRKENRTSDTKECRYVRNWLI